jgi:hypothetical protein
VENKQTEPMPNHSAGSRPPVGKKTRNLTPYSGYGIR